MREVIQKRVVGKHQLKHHPSISVGFAKNTYFFFFLKSFVYFTVLEISKNVMITVAFSFWS